MYAGKIVEQGTVDDIYYKPAHPYTWGLLRSIPRLDTDSKADLVPIPGTPPDLFAPPKGCAFAARCPYAMDICLEQDPEHTKISKDHSAACWLLHPDAPKVERPVGEGGAVHV
jgi:oligopeptide transport system ATP-binding protein